MNHILILTKICLLCEVNNSEIWITETLELLIPIISIVWGFHNLKRIASSPHTMRYRHMHRFQNQYYAFITYLLIMSIIILTKLIAIFVPQYNDEILNKSGWIRYVNQFKIINIYILGIGYFHFCLSSFVSCDCIL